MAASPDDYPLAVMTVDVSDPAITVDGPGSVRIPAGTIVMVLRRSGEDILAQAPDGTVFTAQAGQYRNVRVSE